MYVWFPDIKGNRHFFIKTMFVNPHLNSLTETVLMSGKTVPHEDVFEESQCFSAEKKREKMSQNLSWKS